MNKNHISRPTRRDEQAPHCEVTGPSAEVNAAVAPGSNALLPGETPNRFTLNGFTVNGGNLKGSQQRP